MTDTEGTTTPIKNFHTLIEYTDGTERVFYFTSWREAYNFVVNEGDHVVDYWINGE